MRTSILLILDLPGSQKRRNFLGYQWFLLLGQFGGRTCTLGAGVVRTVSFTLGSAWVGGEHESVGCFEVVVDEVSVKVFIDGIKLGIFCFLFRIEANFKRALCVSSPICRVNVVVDDGFDKRVMISTAAWSKKLQVWVPEN